MSVPTKAWAGDGPSWGKGLVQSLLADREWLDIGRFEAKQELRGRNELGQGKTLGFPQRAQKQTLNCQQDCEDQKYTTEMGEGLTNRLGHKSLKVNPRVGPGFQKADKALPGAEILSQHPSFPFLPISPHCCWRGNRSELKGFSNEWSGSYYLFPPNPRDIVAEPEWPGAVVDCQGSQGPWRGPRSSCQGSSSLWWQRPPISEAAVTEPEALQYNTHLYSMHILLVLVIFHSDKELFPVLCGYFVCSIGLLLELLF